jgi:hypothetical protein
VLQAAEGDRGDLGGELVDRLLASALEPVPATAIMPRRGRTRASATGGRAWCPARGTRRSTPGSPSSASRADAHRRRAPKPRPGRRLASREAPATVRRHWRSYEPISRLTNSASTRRRSIPAASFAVTELTNVAGKHTREVAVAGYAAGVCLARVVVGVAADGETRNGRSADVARSCCSMRDRICPMLPTGMLRTRLM